MNVVLIPFFLAANVVVNDTSKWTFGPEYLYDMNITVIAKPSSHKPIQHYELISTIKCRPKMPDSLFCYCSNSTSVALLKNRNITDQEIMTEQMFEIKFNEYSVEGLVIEPSSDMDVVTILRKIASQFNVVVNRDQIISSHFIARENSTIGDCATMYVITHEESETDTLEEEEDDFRLVVLPLSDENSGTTLSIEKSRMECKSLDAFSGRLTMGRYVTKIQISSDKFETFTEFDGKVHPLSPEIESGDRVFSYKEIIQISLNSIKPAQNELPTLPYGELIDLNIANEISNNFMN